MRGIREEETRVKDGWSKRIKVEKICRKVMHMNLEMENRENKRKRLGK